MSKTWRNIVIGLQNMKKYCDWATKQQENRLVNQKCCELWTVAIAFLPLVVLNFCGLIKFSYLSNTFDLIKRTVIANLRALWFHELKKIIFISKREDKIRHLSIIFYAIHFNKVQNTQFKTEQIVEWQIILIQKIQNKKKFRSVLNNFCLP